MLPNVDAEANVDGHLDDPIWQQALRVPLTIETRPGENVAPPVETEVYLAENGRTLFVGFDASDPRPHEVRAFLRDRDSAWDDDFVGIVLDTFNSERQAVEFFANPLGVQMDAFNDDVNGNEDDSWDAIWDSAGRITERGYQVEMAIPLQQLRFRASDRAQVWGVDLLRFYPRDKRHRISNNPQRRGTNCYLCQLSKMQGFGCAKPGKNLTVAPTLTVSQSAIRDDLVNDPLVTGDADPEFGLDVRWGISPDVTLIGTLNPDFSQVEADTAQLDVNNTFALFFPEKRPFFLDGADFFATPTRAVFSRNIADPDYGIKLLARQNGNSYGVFFAEDTRTNLLFPGAQGSNTTTLAIDSTALAGRARRDIGDALTLGALVTNRQGDGYRNTVAGFDGRYRFNDNNKLQLQYLASDTRYPDATAAEFDQPSGSFAGHSLFSSYRYRTRDWLFRINYDDVDKNYRADLGFIPKVGFDRWVIGGSRTWYPEDGALSEFGVGGDWDITHTDDGRMLEKETEINFYAQGPLQSYTEAGTGIRDRLFNDVLFRENFYFFYGEFQPVGGWFLAFFAETGDQIDFDNTRLGELVELSPRVTANIGRHFQARLRHNWAALDTTSGSNIFTVNLTDLRLTYQFSVRSFLRLVVQYQDIERDPALYIDDVDARSRNLGTQLLYSYKVNPQTVIFLGYSDAAERGGDLASFTTSERTFFAKFGYAWLP